MVVSFSVSPRLADLDRAGATVVEDGVVAAAAVGLGVGAAPEVGVVGVVAAANGDVGETAVPAAVMESSRDRLWNK